jgi:hypothetical protein
MFTSDGVANRIYCMSNLRQIGFRLHEHAAANGNRFPDTLAPLITEPEYDRGSFICPSTDHTPAPGATVAEQAANLLKPGHCSYLYYGRGLTLPLDPGRVLMLEPPDHHGGTGLSVLFGDCRVEFIPIEKAHDLLVRHGFERVEAGREAPPKFR